jgi:hypothetical protein
MVGRMIDEKVLIERLLLESAGCKVYKLINPNIEDVKEFNAYKKCIEIVNQLAEESKGKDTNAPSNNGWIPCSERLPEDKGTYLVTVKNLTGYWIMESNVFVCDYQYDEFIFQGWEDNKVIAWQPLPAPYQPKE